MRSVHSLRFSLYMIAASLLIGCTGVFAASEAAQDAKPAEGASALPKDVYEESYNRLPVVKRENLNEHDKQVFDAVTGSMIHTKLGLRSPEGIRLHSPRLSEITFSGVRYVRFQNVTSRRVWRLAILTSARELDHQFLWTNNEPIALKEGLEQRIVDIIKYRKPLTGLAEEEAAIIQLTREAVGQKKVSSDTFAKALKLFGKEGLVNLVALMGHYSATALLLNTFDQHLTPEQKPLLPMP